MTAVGATPLLKTGWGSASWAAIALPAITIPADAKHAMTSAADALPEKRFARNRHARHRRRLDNGNGSWQVGTSFDVGRPVVGCQPGAPLLATAGLAIALPPQNNELYTASLLKKASAEKESAHGACLGS